MTAQLTPHGAEKVRLRGLAALRTPAPAKATAVLVPGYTGSKEDFAPLLDGLADGGFRAVAIDLPGQFESPGPPDEEAYLPSALGSVVAGLVEEVEGPVVLLGHSFGGLVARAAVLAGAPVAGLTLLDSGPGELPAGARRDALGAGEPVLRQSGLDEVYRVREQVSARSPLWATMPADLKDFLRLRFLASSPAGLLGMARGLRTEPDRVDELAATGVPTLVVAGELDDAWSVPSQREMAARLGAPFEVIPGAAHSPNTENPAALLRVLLAAWREWLA
ncbi:alpha/beta fold hydrolase [Amycolatopsis methanolica]|uniref:Putative hydrolase or acyltransferase of alpha/beta superfamily n=1 Tax=Amycolatopsis methanolica 239 TaxID=1068978 RepID=A0A076MTL1_AMYME|nr:alpha/beta hydrolase [Amycolatopsis methanolica]AIJ21087.1 putative hydrolase or acyltransferase of alpha/beta superfamily [Amycolatopsis methanolica 239]